MSGSFFSASWYRVAELKPRLRGHARLHRHLYRGRPWYVLEDVANQRVHRFTPAVHSVIGLMDGERTVSEIWTLATERLADDAPTQDEVVRLLGQLHAADVLQCDVPPDTAELLLRFERHERQLWKQRLMSPLALRVPLVDPDAALRRVVPFVRPLMGWLGIALWLAVVGPALFLAGSHWSELTQNVLDRVLLPENALLLWLVFPVVKVFHEIGHGLFCRYFGGEVHDMGLMFLLLTPVPYVDASSASAFQEKRHRALVSAAGMIVEIFIAALALYVWVSVQPGAVRTVAYNVMLVAGVTTLTFNANPLLRFDGYYILSDWIEIPNLRQRANDYIRYLVEYHLLGAPDAQPPDTGRGERGWLLAYGVGAFFYRILVFVFILLFVFDLSVVLGTLVAVIAAAAGVLRPAVKGVGFVLASPKLEPVRTRAIAVSGGLLGAVLLLVFALPLPLRTQVQGVVWTPEESFVRAGSDGIVERFLAAPGATVRKGDPLLQLTDPDLGRTVVALEARLRGLSVKQRAAGVDDPARAAMLADEIEHLDRRLARARERLAALVVRSGADGTFVVPRSEDLPGRFVEQGELLAHVLRAETRSVRAVVPQEEIRLLWERLDGVALRTADRPEETLPGRVTRMVPSASPELPSLALGLQGGGDVAVDPRDREGRSAVAPFFQVDIEAPELPEEMRVGGRVHVRFDHGLEPLAVRWYRSLRQLFLARFDV